MASIDGEPLDKKGSPFAIGVLSLLAAVLAVGIQETRGTWPAGYGGLGVAFFVGLGVALIGIGWRTE